MLFVFYSDRRLAPPGDSTNSTRNSSGSPAGGGLRGDRGDTGRRHISAALNALASPPWSISSTLFARQRARSVRPQPHGHGSLGLVWSGSGCWRGAGARVEAVWPSRPFRSARAAGVFLLGTLGAWENDAIAGMITGLVCLTYLRFPDHRFPRRLAGVLVLPKSPVARPGTVIGTVITSW